MSNFTGFYDVQDLSDATAEEILEAMIGAAEAPDGEGVLLLDGDLLRDVLDYVIDLKDRLMFLKSLHVLAADEFEDVESYI